MILGIDLGTTACKAVVVTPDGRVTGSGSADYPLLVPRAGWAEQSSQAVWEGLVVAAQTALAASQSQPHQIEALALSGAMHSLLPLDHQRQPQGSALTWADRRGALYLPTLRDLSDAHEAYMRTGCPFQAPYWPCKLLWFREQRPEVWERVSCWVGLKDNILYRLTGELVTEHGMASTTGLLDIHTRQWDPDLLDALGLPPERLPRLVSPHSTAGGLTHDAAESLGLLPGTEVVAGSSDGALASLGAGAIGPGQLALTIGTSGAVRLAVNQPRLDDRERTWCYILDDERWLAGGAINNGGIVLRWAQEQLGWRDYDALTAEASQAPPGADGLLFLPYLAGERSPYWNASARGVLFGLSLHHTRAHIARAFMEGVAFSLYSVFRVLQQQAHISEVRATGGFTRSPLWTQIVADVIGYELVLLEAQELSALGAAFLALKALGWLHSLEEVHGLVAAGQRVAPVPEAHERYAAAFPLFEAIYFSLLPHFETLQQSPA
jgi:gluconokinase